ncbi:hypothetical protein LTR17_006376 [Elasticomyces elasticus]|nr:hypothetical protein LTR17_006376 [Elasticomyces elasticus]
MPELGHVTLTLRSSGQTYDEYELQKEIEDGRSVVRRRTTPDIDEQAKVVLKLASGFELPSARCFAVRVTVGHSDRLVVHDQVFHKSHLQAAKSRGIKLAALISLPSSLPADQEAVHPSHPWTCREGVICVAVAKGSALRKRDMYTRTWEVKVTKTQRTRPNGWITYCPGWTPLASDGEGTMLSFEIRPPGYTSDNHLLTKVQYLPSSAAKPSSATKTSGELPAHHEDGNVNGPLDGMEPDDQPTSLPSTGVRHNTTDRTEPATPKRPRSKQPRMGSKSSAKAPPRTTGRARPEPSVCGNGEQDAYGWDQNQDDEEVKPSALQLSQAAARVVLPGPRESADQSSVDEPVRSLSDASGGRPPSVVGAADRAANSSAGKRKSTDTSDEEDDMDELHDQLREVELKEKKIELEEKKIKINRKMRKLNKKAA